MSEPKLIRITTVPISLEKLLEGQLKFMADFFNVTAISAEKKRLDEYGNKECVSTFHLPLTRSITPLRDFASLVKLYLFLKKRKPHIVHTHTPKAGIVGMLAAKLAGVPIRLHTVAGLPLMEASGIKRAMLNAVEKLTYACATNVYPNSRGLYNFILKQNFAPQAKLKIIGNGSSNGINTEYFNPSHFSEKDRLTLREKQNIPAFAFVFIFVGRIVKDKGIGELVQAFCELDIEENNIKLLLVGPLESELDPLKPQTIREVEKNVNIITTGYQDDVRPYFAMSDALVFPSYREGFPNVVLQAGAMGLPAIVSDINGCNEIITHKFNGLIVPAKDDSALRKAMSALQTDAQLQKKLSGNARPEIVKKYQRSTVWKALLEEYKRVLQKKGIDTPF